MYQVNDRGASAHALHQGSLFVRVLWSVKLSTCNARESWFASESSYAVHTHHQCMGQS